MGALSCRTMPPKEKSDDIPARTRVLYPWASSCVEQTWHVKNRQIGKSSNVNRIEPHFPYRATQLTDGTWDVWLERYDHGKWLADTSTLLGKIKIER